MDGIDGTRDRGTAAGRWLRIGRLAAAGTVLVGGAMVGLAAQPAYAGPVTCGGLTEAAARTAGYTIFNNAFSGPPVIVVGGPGKDWIVGGAGADILDGQGGDDLICGRGGNDDLRGLSGDDQIFGGGDIDPGTGGAGTNVCDANTETRISC